MNSVLPRLDKRPPQSRGRPASPGKPFIRPARPVASPVTFDSLAPVLRAAAILIAAALLVLTLEQGVADLVERVRVLMMPRI